MGPTALTACIVARSHWFTMVGLQATSLSACNFDWAVSILLSLPHVLGARILSVVKHLSEDIGYQTVGTLEHALADKYMVAQAEEVKKNCEKLMAESGRKLECEVRCGDGKEVGATDLI
ncbi:uncharacterized protein LACBIDRAFT_308176 [Laccaria bicolor S238N-H82]|uniref:Predicted protein n=1 Tax=Laccaria bicolor (strain S238N-H82 / ATCC MYA-4686) TaxID=486041 RepID=B0DRS4_LACBS|nr:uncharacterized protein LACBIDRAFT_308176 [Laccaria bicolor S238N-H82]EDR02660.1 predicted protein [Laccaria bicolor S238N-H82]|eukprot:XP_001886704.1 predicted protein [Laccaria bicolor S238N-H82]